MLVILYPRSCQKIAMKVAADLRKAFSGHVKIRLVATTSLVSWPTASWDDLLIVVFDGKPFPDGAKWVKIQWNKKQNPTSPYFVEIPATLASVAFIVKDSKRFPDTHGYAFGQFDYDNATGTFKTGTLGSVPISGSECGYACHAAHVASTDYIFTAYAPR